MSALKTPSVRYADAKPGQGPVSEMPLAAIKPARQNDVLYRPITADDPDLIELARNIQKHGVLEPLLMLILQRCVLPLIAIVSASMRAVSLRC